MRTFRLSCAAAHQPLVEDLLRAEGYDFTPENFFAPARRLLAEPKPLGSSLAAFFGLIYIQDRASMLPPLALNPPPGAAVLDMCASPGSKTGQLSLITGPNGFVLGNEPSAPRLATLRRNLLQLGLPQSATCGFSGEALPLPDALWNYIQLDPPCSGWGTADRNPNVTTMWQGEKTLPLVRLQRTLLAEATRLLAPGGHLAYSTCTTNPQENMEQASFAEQELGLVPHPLPPLQGFELEPGPAHMWQVRTVPGHTQGFFVARFCKPGTAQVLRPAPVLPQERLAFTSVDPARLADAGLKPELLPSGSLAAFGDSLHFLPAQALEMLPRSFRWQGLYLGKVSSPSPRLKCIDSLLPGLDMDTPASLASLRALLQGQSLPWQGKGKFAALRWRSLPLGLARIKGNRLLWSER